MNGYVYGTRYRYKNVRLYIFGNSSFGNFSLLIIIDKLVRLQKKHRNSSEIDNYRVSKSNVVFHAVFDSYSYLLFDLTCTFYRDVSGLKVQSGPCRLS